MSNGSAVLVSWSDRWLGCLADGQKAFQRRWISLTDSELHISYDPSDAAGPIQSFVLRNLSLSCDATKFLIEIASEDDGCLFRCGEALEFSATWAALQRIVHIAQSQCQLCAQLQMELDALAKEREDNLAKTTMLNQQQSKLADLEIQNVALNTAVTTTQNRLKELQEQLSACEQRRTVSEARALAAEKRERETSAESKNRQREFEDEQHRRAQTHEELVHQLNANHKEQERVQAEELQRLQIANLQASAAESESKHIIAGLRHDVDVLRAANQVLQTRVETLNREHLSLTADTQSIRNRLDEALRQRDDCEAKFSNAIAELKATEVHLNAEKEGLRVAKSEEANHRRQLSDSEQRLQQAVLRNADLQQKLTDAQDFHSAEMRTLRSDITARDLHITEAQSLSIRQQSSHAAEVQQLRSNVSDLDAALSREMASNKTNQTAIRKLTAERDESESLANEARRRRAISRRDAGVNTVSFSELLERDGEICSYVNTHMTRQRHVMVARVADMLSHVSETALVELEELVFGLQSLLKESIDENLQSSSGSPRSQEGSPRRSNQVQLTVSSIRTLGQAVNWIDLAEELLAGLSTKIGELVSRAEDADSPLSRAILVAREAGYLDAIDAVDAAANAIADSNKIRDRVLVHLRNEGTAARSLASAVLSAPRALRNSLLEATCKAVDANFCSLFDKCVKSASVRAGADATWLRNATRLIGRSKSRAIAINAVEQLDEAKIDEWSKEAFQIFDSLRGLLQSECSKSHAAEMRDAIDANFDLQTAVFLACRRFNRGWLRHHQCAESIARFGLALKRAGQLLDKAKIRGSEQFVAECNAGWPVVKSLCELPRRLLDEDRAFHVMWDAVIDLIRRP